MDREENAEALLTNFRALKAQAVGARRRAERYALSTFWDKSSTMEQLTRLQSLYERERELNERCALVAASLKRLDGEDRGLLVQCYVLGKSYRELAGRLPYSERTFYRRRQRALVRFARLAEEEQAYSSSKLSLS